MRKVPENALRNRPEFAVAAALALTCGTPAAQMDVAYPLTAGPDGLPAFFDCVRANGGILVSAHRGGPMPGFPENAIETFANTLRLMPAILEIDVAVSRDGTLVLMHDSRLERTSTGSGPVADRSLEELAALRLRDNAGRITDYRIPTLAAALDFAAGRTILVLDRKEPATYADILAAVAAAEAYDRVFVATYTMQDALALLRNNRRIMVAAPIEDRRAVDMLLASGVASSRVLAWTGIVEHRPDLFEQLDKHGIESMFGTLGDWSESHDNRIRAAGNDAAYVELAVGLQVIATDRPLAVARVLPGVPRAAQACSAGR